jgi:hypothetical protein
MPAPRRSPERARGSARPTSRRRRRLPALAADAAKSWAREILVGVVTAVLGAVIVARLDLDKPSPGGAKGPPPSRGAAVPPASPAQAQPLLDEWLRLLFP